MTTTAGAPGSTATDKVTETHDTLLDLVEGLQSSANWTAALDHRYNFGNGPLIAAPHARAYAEGGSQIRRPTSWPDTGYGRL